MESVEGPNKANKYAHCSTTSAEETKNEREREREKRTTTINGQQNKSFCKLVRMLPIVLLFLDWGGG